MKNILVIGGGAMGSAFTIPSLENKNNVTITEPYSKRFIKDLSSKKKFHSALKIKLPKQLKFRKFSKNLLKENFDLIVIALSLPGIDFIGKELKDLSFFALMALKLPERMVYYGTRDEKLCEIFADLFLGVTPGGLGKRKPISRALYDAIRYPYFGLG